MKHLRWSASLFLVTALLAACNQDAQPTPAEPGFAFSVDPGGQSVTLQESSAHALETLQTCTPGQRNLTPGSELELAAYTAAFAPGNILTITASFTNTTPDTFTQPFSFTAAPSTTNIASSTEPTVTDADLGGDGELAPNETSSVLTFTVQHQGQPFTYEVFANANVVCSGTPPNDATFTLTKVDDVPDGDSVDPGGLITYALTATNTSSSESGPVTFTETVPAQTTFNASESTPGWSCNQSGACTLTTASLDAGDFQPVFFSVNVNQDAAVLVVNTASVDDDSDTTPPDATASEDTLITTPEPPDATFTLTKDDNVDDGNSVAPGDILVYGLTATNTSSTESGPVTFTETVPDQTTFSPIGSSPGFGCDENGVCTITAPSVEANGSRVVLFAVTVNQNATGTINNTASVDDDSDTTPPDATASETTPIEQPVTLYSSCNFSGGFSVSLGEGNYSASDLAALGMPNNNVSSMKVRPGFRAEIFDGDNFDGTSLSFTGDDDCLGNNGFNDRLGSIRVTRLP